MVSQPRNATDVGIYLLHYISSIAGMSECQLNTESLECDGHRSVLSLCPHFTYNESKVMKLRQEHLQLVPRASEKYCNVHIDPVGCSNTDDMEEEGCKCCITTAFLPENMTLQCQRCRSNCSSDEGSRFSDNSGSEYSPEEHDIRPDESERLYDDNGYCSSQDKKKE